MATVGSVDVNLGNIGDIVNNTTETGAAITGGVADQGDLIGLGIGIAVAFGAIAVGLGAIIGIIFLIFTMIRGIRKSAKRI